MSIALRRVTVALSVIITIALTVAYTAQAAPAIQVAGPILSIPTIHPAGAPGSVAVPIDFQGANSGVASMAFSIDVESDCLIVDAVGFHLPPQFRGSASYDGDDLDGELDITIADYAPPLSTLPDLMPLLTITFDVICLPEEGDSLDSALRFSRQPPASFSNTIGSGISGIVEDGSVVITLATPTPIPSETPERNPDLSPTPPTVNTAPIVQDDHAQTSEYRPVTLDVLANDRDPDGNDLHVIEVSQGAFGTVTVHGDNTITYLPEPGRNGDDLFTYTVSDNEGGLSIASVTVNVTDVNIPPVAVNDLFVVEEDGELKLDLLANDHDPDGPGASELYLAVLGQPEHGTLHPTDAGLIYTPAPDFYGEDRFAYAITDAEGGSAVGEVVIAVSAVNDPPQGMGIADRVLNAGELLSLHVDVHDVDSPLSELRFAATGLPPGLTMDPGNGEINGVVDDDASGEYVVTVTIDDGEHEIVFQTSWLVSAPTAIDFAGLNATAAGEAIEVTWGTRHDREMTGFRLSRTTITGTQPNWVAVSDFIPATAPEGEIYRFTDRFVVPGVAYRYLLTLYNGDVLVAEHISASVMTRSGEQVHTFLPIARR